MRAKRLISLSLSLAALLLCLSWGGAWVRSTWQKHLLFQAAETNDRSLLAEAQYGAQLESRNRDGETPLVVATRSGSHDVAVALIQAGADVNAAVKPVESMWGRRDFALTGSTPLLFAVGHGDAPLVKLLLDHGADPKPAPAELGLAPLMVAREHHYHEITQLLRDRIRQPEGRSYRAGE